MSHEKRVESVENLIQQAKDFLENLADKTIDQLNNMHSALNEKVDCLTRKRDAHLLKNEIKVLKCLRAKVKRFAYNLASGHPAL